MTVSYTHLDVYKRQLFVFFRDIQYLWGIFTQLLMYMSAIFYTIDRYSHTVQHLFLLNPVYLFIRYFRKIVIEATIPTVWFHLLMGADALIMLGIGCWMYKKYNHRFLYYCLLYTSGISMVTGEGEYFLNIPALRISFFQCHMCMEH